MLIMMFNENQAKKIFPLFSVSEPSANIVNKLIQIQAVGYVCVLKCYRFCLHMVVLCKLCSTRKA